VNTRKLWRDSMRPRIEQAQVILREVGLPSLAERSGGDLLDGAIELALFTTPLRITSPDFSVRRTDGEACPEEIQILLLDYLLRSIDHPAPRSAATRWIGFQELPDGAFYAKAFRSYSSDLLTRELDGGLAAFRVAAAGFGGEPIEFGDASFAFRGLPAVRLAVVWQEGDDEFPANANILFDSMSKHALPIDGFAALGGLLCRGLLAVASNEDESERAR